MSRTGTSMEVESGFSKAWEPGGKWEMTANEGDEMF